MVWVNISVKEADSLVSYTHFRSFKVNNVIGTGKTVNFHIPTLIKEVKQTPKKELKSIRNQIVTFLTTASAFTMLPLRSMAASVPATTLPKTATGIPPELMDLMIMLLTISVGAGIILAAILLVLAGMSRMFGKKMRKDATEWTVDILRGLIQILVSVPIVFILYYVATLIFKSSGWFVSPF